MHTPTDPAAELARVEAENESLRSELETHSAQRRAGRHKHWSITLAVIAGILLPLGVLTIWVRNQLLDTDRYVETVTPLGSDPHIQAAIADGLATKVNDEIDFGKLTRQVLPDKARVLSPVLANAAQSLTHELADKVVHSDAFETVWVSANRRAHAAAVDVLTGEGRRGVSTDRGRIVVHLGPLVNNLLERLDKRFGVDLATKVPTSKIGLTYTLLDSPDLAKLQSQLKLFNKLSYLTFILALAALVAAVFVAEDRRRGVKRIGIAIAVSMFVLLLGFATARTLYLDNVPRGSQGGAAAAAVFDIFTRFIHQTIRTLFTIGLLVVVIAWSAGPSRSAQRVRGWWGALAGRVGSSDMPLGPVPSWVADHLGPIRIAIVSLAAVTIVLWSRPTGKVVVLITFIALVLLGVAQLLAAPATHHRTAEPPLSA